MEEILDYEKRDQLYDFLINDFGFVKIDERYDPNAFGNFYITLSAENFLLRYINDRSFLDIEIASKLEPDEGFSLSFVKDFIYNPESINCGEEKDNSTRIRGLNEFIKKDFLKISQLYNRENYYNTKKQIDKLLRERFERRHPGLTE